MTSEKPPATTTAKTIAGSTSMVSSLNDHTAVYEPTPTKAAWPKLR